MMMINQLQIFFVCFLFRLSNGWCLHDSFLQFNQVQCIDYSPDGTLLLTVVQDHLSVWDAITKQLIYRLTLDEGQCGVFSNDGTMIGVSDKGSDVQVISSTSPYGLIGTFDSDGDNNKHTILEFSRDSSQILMCTNDKKAKVYTVSTGNKDFQEGNKALGCSIDANGNVVTGRKDDKIRYYNSGGSQLYEIDNSHTKDCQDLHFSEDGKTIVAACKDEGLIFTNSTQTQTLLIDQGSTVRTAEISKNSNYYIFGDENMKAYLVNATSGNHTVIGIFTFQHNVLDMDFTNDEQFFVVATEDGKVYEYARDCLKCNAGYYKNATTISCELCWTTLHGCGECNTSTYCIQCVEGYLINTGTNQCQSCQDLIEGCGTCEDSTTCKFCLPQFYLVSDACLRCVQVMDGCLLCNETNYCEMCELSFFLNSDNLCERCQGIANCSRCVNSTDCYQCHVGFYLTSGSCTKCTSHCLVCQSSSNCTDCMVGYYPSTTSGCLRCPSFCLACNATQYCTDCVNQKYLSSGNCIDCPFPCATCNSSSYCTSCAGGYYFDGGICQQCPSSCVSCNDSSYCESCSVGLYQKNGQCLICQELFSFCSQCQQNSCFICQNGYYLDASGDCQSCLIMYACTSCNTSTNCFACSTDTYLTSNSGNDSCASCSLGCSTCLSSTNCTNCHIGYYLNTGADSCVLCSGNCVTCTSSMNCLSCQIGFYLSGVSCLSCSTLISGCTACYNNGTDICLSCQLGMKVSADGQSCEICPQNCTSCNDTQTCDSCEVGYYLQVDGSCQQCHHNCSECENSQTHCTSCSVGFYLSTNTCEDCGQLGCATCNSSLLCESCKIGYYKTTANQCEHCLSTIDNCLVCTSSTICLQCSYGYLISAAQTSCTPCSVIEGCKHCQNLAYCLNCEIGYYFDAGTCIQCDAGCKACQNSTSCTQCIAGYFEQSPGCELCSSLIDGCKLCSDNVTCTKCQNGYYLDSTTNQCNYCSNAMLGCSYCNSSTICVHCNDGFYMNANQCFICDQSLQGCQICNSSSVCLSCDYGYYLDSGVCSLCHVSLASCIYCSDINTCQKCQSGYFLDSGACQNCQAQIPGCIYCNSGTQCIQCQGGYYLDTLTNLCSACEEKGCQICLEDDPKKCLKCNIKYYLNSTQENCIYCRSTLSGCLKCDSSTKCIQCDEGYYVDGIDQCSLCSGTLPACGKCTSSSVCIQCKSGFYVNGINECEQCRIPVPGCSYCINGSACESCSSGYFLNSSVLCELCTNVDGCLACINESYCQFCEANYFLENRVCYPCSVMTGCYACTSNLTCSVCKGGYIINDDQLCEPMRVEAYEQVTKLKLKSLFVNETVLQHILYARGMLFNSTTQPNWTKTTDLILQDQKYVQTELQILQGVFGQKGYDVIFYTNNPLKIDKSQMPLTRLLLSGSLTTGHRVNLRMDQETINQILPDLYLNKDLVMDYQIDSAQFAMSYGKQNISFGYGIFGVVITCLLLILFLVKSICTVPTSYEMGQIMPHIFALKMPAIIIFPSYLQFINYCYGFMTPDFPWANFFFGDLISDQSDIQPSGYALFYSNMNIGSTYFVALILVFLFAFGFILAFASEEISFSRRPAFTKVIHNFFIFGIISCSCASFYGSLLNPIQVLSINSFLYILGIIIYFIALIEAVFSITQSSTNFYRLRIFIKATLLSFAPITPIYLFSAALITDFICIYIDYYCIKIKNNELQYQKIWIYKNIACNVSLGILGFVAGTYLAIILCSALVVSVLVLEIYVQAKQYLGKRKMEVKDQSSATLNEGQKPIWELNFDKNEQFKDEKEEQSEKNRTRTTKFLDSKSDFHKRKRIKRTKDSPKPDILNINDLEKDKKQLEEPGINTFKAGDYLD